MGRQQLNFLSQIFMFFKINYILTSHPSVIWNENIINHSIENLQVTLFPPPTHTPPTPTLTHPHFSGKKDKSRHSGSWVLNLKPLQIIRFYFVTNVLNKSRVFNMCKNIFSNVNLEKIFACAKTEYSYIFWAHLVKFNPFFFIYCQIYYIKTFLCFIFEIL